MSQPVTFQSKFMMNKEKDKFSNNDAGDNIGIELMSKPVPIIKSQERRGSHSVNKTIDKKNSFNMSQNDSNIELINNKNFFDFMKNVKPIENNKEPKSTNFNRIPSSTPSNAPGKRESVMVENESSSISSSGSELANKKYKKKLSKKSSSKNKTIKSFEKQKSYAEDLNNKHLEERSDSEEEDQESQKEENESGRSIKIMKKENKVDWRRLMKREKIVIIINNIF